jgi:lipoyl(octanoyl) transferase
MGVSHNETSSHKPGPSGDGSGPPDVSPKALKPGIEALGGPPRRLCRDPELPPRAAQMPSRDPQLPPGAPLPVIDLGVAPYLPLQALQQRLRQAVIDRRLPGVLLLLEHEPVITLGSRGGLHDLRSVERASVGQIPVVRSERGGQATLHAPGQLVCYPIVAVPGKDLSAYVRSLEEVVLRVLDRLGIVGHRRPGRPGVYVAGRKIASVGLRCQRWVASHGTSLNVSNDLSLFDLIVSCGEPELQQTSLTALKGRSPDMSAIKSLYLEAAAEVFGWTLAAPCRMAYQQVEGRLLVERSDEARGPKDRVAEERFAEERLAEERAAE